MGLLLATTNRDAYGWGHLLAATKMNDYERAISWTQLKG